MKIDNIDRENLNITKITKNQGFTLSLEDTFLKKLQSGSN